MRLLVLRQRRGRLLRGDAAAVRLAALRSQGERIVTALVISLNLRDSPAVMVMMSSSRRAQGSHAEEVAYAGANSQSDD